MIDMRWNETDTFEAACTKAPFSELIRLAFVIGVALRDQLRGEARHGRFDGLAGHAAS